MSPPAPDLSRYQSLDLQGFDRIFLDILNELLKETINGTRACTEAIFKLSSSYVEKPAIEALKRFYDLYFGSEDIEMSKQRIHQEVDNLVENLQAKLQAGEEIDESQVEEKYMTERLGLAGVQKQLEGLITLDAGLKDRILPALSSMQFEDAVNQRLEHIYLAWEAYAQFFVNTSSFGQEMEPVARELAKNCSSVEESTSYYRLMLKEEPPPGQESRSIFLEF